MTEFTLDTSGAVPMVNPAAPEWALKEAYTQDVRWPDLSPFEQGYVEAMFASLRDHWNTIAAERGHDPANLTHPSFSDLAPETLAAIRKDCAAMVARERTSDPGALRHNGAITWAHRQRGLLPDFPPLAVTLNDAGKVVFS